ncbi:pilin [Piscinibacter sp. XHJ-5]|uniref:pilin n=1 Tax=Piscinibacter sp. XHJ-5 TaxID=3037797 RepID=UPI002452F295|nr:pilin [Piscinibacter sp. XHJ-5]
MNRPDRGFTLIEVMVVLAILVVLAAMATPSIHIKLVRDQVVEAAKLADVAKAPVAQAWAVKRELPADNEAAGLPSADKIVSTWVSSVSVEGGAIHLTFGNQASAAIRGRRLTLRPAVVDDAPVVPVSWVCGHASTPDKMSSKGIDRTDLDAKFLPSNCR